MRYEVQTARQSSDLLNLSFHWGSLKILTSKFTTLKNLWKNKNIVAYKDNTVAILDIVLI